MRRAVRRCPTPRTATTDGSGGTVRGPAAGSAAVRPQRRGGRGGPTPTAPHVRPAGTVSAGVCAPGQPARPPDTTADASAAAPPLQLAVVRHGSGYRPAMRHGSRTPAVRSAASGAVGIHWQNDQRACPSRLRQKGRSGCVQTAVMEPVGGHLTAARVAFCLDTPSAHRTIWPHRTGRRKQRTVNPPIARNNFLYSSSRPACGRAASGGRPRPATTRPDPGRRPHPPHSVIAGREARAPALTGRGHSHAIAHEDSMTAPAQARLALVHLDGAA
jgi:hypothetical protein